MRRFPDNSGHMQFLFISRCGGSMIRLPWRLPRYTLAYRPSNGKSASCHSLPQRLLGLSARSESALPAVKCRCLRRDPGPAKMMVLKHKSATILNFFFYSFPIGFGLAVFVAAHVSYTVSVKGYGSGSALVEGGSRCWRNPRGRIAKLCTRRRRIWGGRFSQSQGVSFRNGRWPRSCGLIRTPLLSTTWHNFPGAALTASKAFSHAATGTMGGSAPRIDDSVGQWSSKTRLSVQMAPAVTEHRGSLRWSCSTVAMLVTKNPSSLSLLHFFMHATLWHVHLITLKLWQCVCVRVRACVTTTLTSCSFDLFTFYPLYPLAQNFKGRCSSYIINMLDIIAF